MTTGPTRPLGAMAAIALYGWVNGALAAGAARLGERLDLSSSAVAAHLVAFAVGLVAAGSLPSWGRGARVAPALFAGVLVAFLGAPSLGVSILAAFAMGGAGSATLAAAQADLARRPGAAAARLILVANIAAAATAAFAAAAIAATGPAQTMLAALPAVALAIVALSTRGDPATRVDADTGRRQRRGSGPRIGERPTRVDVLGLVLIALVVAIEATSANQLTSFLTRTGVPEGLAARGPALLFAGLTLGRVVGAVFASVPAHRQLRASLVVTVAALVVVVAPLPDVVRTSAALVAGLGLGPLYPLSIVSALSTARHPDRMSALSTASIGTALITAPFLVGAGIDLVTPRVGFSVLPALGVCALVVVAATRHARRRDDDRGIVDAG